METVTTANTGEKIWGGGDNQPMGASYGKLMMWFFILSDALTFSGFLAAYGFSRFYTRSVYARQSSANALCSIYDFYFDFFICNDGSGR
jgi:heme/copper-type cytochrome/quinol oxidase subunit 3